MGKEFGKDALTRLWNCCLQPMKPVRSRYSVLDGVASYFPGPGAAWVSPVRLRIAETVKKSVAGARYFLTVDPEAAFQALKDARTTAESVLLSGRGVEVSFDAEAYEKKVGTPVGPEMDPYLLPLDGEEASETSSRLDELEARFERGRRTDEHTIGEEGLELLMTSDSPVVRISPGGLEVSPRYGEVGGRAVQFRVDRRYLLRLRKGTELSVSASSFKEVSIVRFSSVDKECSVEQYFRVIRF